MNEGSLIKGSVFDVQRFSIHDGPGIRTTVFLKGCPLDCFWCQNPESKRSTPEIFFYKEKCTNCGTCSGCCPSGASSIINNISAIDREKCTGCGTCAEMCPTQARKITGSYMTVNEVLEIVTRDRSFYENSGGGLTISGGEPLLQGDFAGEILRESQKRGLHTAVETCGCVPWAQIEPLLEHIDLVLFDIKHIDREKHRAGTGRSNELILDNVRKIDSLRPLWVRVPLIPGFNDDTGSIQAINDFVKAELHPEKVELMAYNKMGESKYDRLDRKPAGLETQDEKYLQMLRSIVQ